MNLKSPITSVKQKPVFVKITPTVRSSHINKPNSIIGDTTSQYTYCKSLYENYKQNCGILHKPVPSNSNNIWSYVLDFINWSVRGNRSGIYVNCLKEASDKFSECMKSSSDSFDKQLISSYVTTLGTWINPHLQLVNNMQLNTVIANRVKGCDGGFNSNGTSNIQAQQNDIIYNNSKGYIQNLNFDDFSSTGFCKCPLNSSFNATENKCKCTSGNPVYSFGSISSTLGNKLACCTTVNCNDATNNPGFDENVINTYKFYDCITHTCNSYS